MCNRIGKPSIREIVEKVFAAVMATAILAFVACGTIAMCVPNFVHLA